jgi:hypothetical protein
MRSTKKKFVLNQAPNALWAAPDQAAWQRVVTTILSPFRVVMDGFALGIYYLLATIRGQRARGSQHFP